MVYKSPKDMRIITPVVQPLPTNTAVPRNFVPMLNGTGINQLTRINTNSRTPEVDEITGLATITEGSFKVFIEQYRDLTGELRVSTHKLLDLCTIALTRQNHFRGEGAPKNMVTISLDEYMELCGIPATKASKDKTRRKVKEDLETLYSTSIEWSEKSGKQQKDYLKMRIITAHGIKNGKILVGFSPEIAGYLTQAYIMQYPMALLKVDERSPSSYYIGKKLMQHFSMLSNQRRGTANILSVRALLDSCKDTIPSYEHVMSGDRKVTQKIVKPFEKALDSIEDLVRWEYCNAKGVALTEDQLAKMDYHTFVELYVHFEVKGVGEVGEEDGNLEG